MDMRYITLTDGTGMGNQLIIFKTDAPVDVLKKLEKESCEVYLNGGDCFDVPIWAQVLEEQGYTCEFVGAHQHITPHGTSTVWLENHKIGSRIREHYTIDNQPNVK